MTPAEQAKKAMTKTVTPLIYTQKDYLSTGVTPIDMALCPPDLEFGGICPGHIYHVAGRTSGGKTFLCRTILAEAANNPRFVDYDLVYDDVERGAELIHTAKFFGEKLAKRLVAPAYKGKEPVYSSSTLDFYRRLNKRLEKKKCIWVEDSLDALEADAESKMSDGKAKTHSQELRRLVQPLSETGSILILVSQVRANMNAGTSWNAPEDIVAGGRALEHYPSGTIWLRKQKSLRVKHKGQTYTNGRIIRADVKKNRSSGLEDRVLFFPFYPSMGIDDVGACVSYLLTVKHWQGEKAAEEEAELPKCITAPEFAYEGPVSILIDRLAEGDKYQQLRSLVSKVWKGIDTAIAVNRRCRYS